MPSPDAVDADVGPISIEVHDEYDAPTANVDVTFTAPDGSSQTVKTNAMGVATASSPPDTTISFMAMWDSGPMERIFAGTRPGDHVIATKLVGSVEVGVVIGHATFTLDSFVGANAYLVTVTCGGGGGATPSVYVDLHGCAAAGNGHAVGWVVDSSNSTPISGPSVLGNLDLLSAPNTTIAMPPYSGSPIAISGSVANLPTDLVADWDAYYYFSPEPVPIAHAASALPSQMMMLPVGDRTQMHVQVSANPNPNPYVSWQWFDRYTNTRETALALDASTLVPAIENPTYDSATRTLSWTEGTGTPSTIVNALILGQSGGVDLHVAHTTSIVLPPLSVTLDGQLHMSIKTVWVDGASYDDLIQIVGKDVSFVPQRQDPTFAGTVMLAYYSI